MANMNKVVLFNFLNKTNLKIYIIKFKIQIVYINKFHNCIRNKQSAYQRVK